MVFKSLKSDCMGPPYIAFGCGEGPVVIRSFSLEQDDKQEGQWIDLTDRQNTAIITVEDGEDAQHALITFSGDIARAIEDGEGWVNVKFIPTNRETECD